MVSTDHNDLIAYQVGDAGKNSAGDYEIDVLLQDAGEKASAKVCYFQDKESGIQKLH